MLGSWYHRTSKVIYGHTHVKKFWNIPWTYRYRSDSPFTTTVIDKSEKSVTRSCSLSLTLLCHRAGRSTISVSWYCILVYNSSIITDVVHLNDAPTCLPWSPSAASSPGWNPSRTQTCGCTHNDCQDLLTCWSLHHWYLQNI